jgi:hypothetical protein
MSGRQKSSELEQLIECFEHFKVLNKRVNEFKILNPFSENRIQKFEDDFGFKLPADYRYFITNCTRGILHTESPSLNVMDQIKLNHYAAKSNKWNPGRPFAHEKRLFFGELNEDDTDYYPYETNYVNVHTNIVHMGLTNGVMTLVGAGCGAFYFIVVNGPESGNVWYDNIGGFSEIAPDFDKEKNLSRLSFPVYLKKEIEKVKKYESFAK